MKLGCTLAWLAVAGILALPVASAHAYIVQSHPANGDRWDTLPPSVHLLYTEGLQRGEAVVLDERGERVDTGAFDLDPADSRSAYVPLRPGGDGVYVLQWRVLSVDTHVTSGSLYFLVGNATPTRETILEAHEAGAHASDVSWDKSLSKAVLLASLATLLGVPATAALTVQPFLWKDTLPASGHLRLRRILLAASLTGMGASAALALPSLGALSGWSAGALTEAVTSTATGRLLLLHAISLGLVALLALRAPFRVLLPVSMAVAVTAQGGISWLSHSGSFVGQWVGGAADLAHLVGSGLWFGGLLCLAIVVWPDLRRREDATSAGPRFIRRFSLLAVAGLALTAAAGLLIASWFVPTLGSVTSTTYGSALGWKTFLLVVAISAGVLNRTFWTPRIERTNGQTAMRGFRRTLTLEIACLAGVLLLSGVMTTSPTAVAGAHAGLPEFHESQGTLGQAEVDLSVIPASVGFNVFDLRLERDGEPWSGPDNVTVILRQSERGIELPAVILDREAPGTYQTVAAIGFPGNWTLRYSYFLQGEGFFAETTNLDVASPSADHGQHSGMTATVSDGPLRTPLAIASGAAAAAGIVAILVETAQIRREGTGSRRTA